MKNDKAKHKAESSMILLNEAGLNNTAEAWKLKATKEDHELFWDGVVRDGDIPTEELTDRDRTAFDEALDRLGEDQTPAFESFDELRAAQLDFYDSLDYDADSTIE